MYQCVCACVCVCACLAGLVTDLPFPLSTRAPQVLNRRVYSSMDLSDVAPRNSFAGGHSRASLLRLMAVAPLNPFASAQTNAVSFCAMGARFNHCCVANAMVRALPKNT